MSYATDRLPSPKPNNTPSIHDFVMQDIADRKAFGIESYGTPLQAHNERDAWVDAYQESLDQSCYLRKMLEERSLLISWIESVRSIVRDKESIDPSTADEVLCGVVAALRGHPLPPIDGVMGRWGE